MKNKFNQYLYGEIFQEKLKYCKEFLDIYSKDEWLKRIKK